MFGCKCFEINFLGKIAYMWVILEKSTSQHRSKGATEKFCFGEMYCKLLFSGGFKHMLVGEGFKK